MKKISIVTPCYNEEPNVRELYRQVKAQFELLKDRYTYEHIFIDNASTDHTVAVLKEIAAEDKNVKIIVNAMNFGHIRSPFYGLCQASGDAAMLMVADLQDPPELIPQFLQQWEEGRQVVIGVKNKSEENPIMYGLRTSFYKMIKAISETRQVENFTGFGLYDKSFIHLLRSIDDPYPYMRGLVAEYGGDLGEVFYTQPKRLHGKTHNNFYTLYDMAMLIHALDYLSVSLESILCPVEASLTESPQVPKVRIRVTYCDGMPVEEDEEDPDEMPVFDEHGVGYSADGKKLLCCRFTFRSGPRRLQSQHRLLQAQRSCTC